MYIKKRTSQKYLETLQWSKIAVSFMTLKENSQNQWFSTTDQSSRGLVKTPEFGVTPQSFYFNSSGSGLGNFNF